MSTAKYGNYKPEKSKVFKFEPFSERLFLRFDSFVYFHLLKDD